MRTKGGRINPYRISHKSPVATKNRAVHCTKHATGWRDRNRKTIADNLPNPIYMQECNYAKLGIIHVRYRASRGARFEYSM